MPKYTVEVSETYTVWMLDGLWHRAGGPAHYDSDGYESWWKYGERHREDGPAVIRKDGSQEWWLEDVHYTEEEFNKKMNPSTKEMTVEELEEELGYPIKIVKD